MIYAQIGLLLLQLASLLLKFAQSRRDFEAGMQSEVAKTSLRILALTEEGKRIQEKLDVVSGSDLDALLRSLESDSDGQLLPGVSESSESARRRNDPGI